ncbi:hypothetical protein H7347_03015 [Corynebacterium sp. zg-331]|uniref:hypothetical protein n=1 Tax=unclassified Corynebacterium TaxID=2624378 RepID=UPI00128B1089|nr:MULTISPECIES: hypothetical protein [unclassified Corynebacterium]MBC3185554.1 hypothetical protein [Corynebacterium sp. zg-331]MPV52048.1 hypothetical protein [Corynebacterium sp. zg331]
MSTPATAVRSEFEPAIEQFLTDLTTFVSGAYLHEEEKDRWDQPFDPDALEELGTILHTLLDRVEGESPQAVPVFLRATIAELHAFNDKHHGAVLEPEEYAELNDLFTALARTAGVPEEALNDLPILE